MYNIVYCFDKNYQQHFAASLESLVRNFSKDPSILTIHIITDSISEKLKVFIENFSKRNSVIFNTIILNSENLSILDNIPQKFRNIKGYINISTYFRLMIPILIDVSVDKVVYVDSDTIFVSNVSDLFEVGLSEKSIGAVLDVDDKSMSEKHGLDAYYNAGLLVMSLDSLRLKEFSNKTISYMSGESCDALMGDQCAINIVMRDDICEIDEKWNRYASNTEFSISQAEDRLAGAGMIHFITSTKPWHAWFANKLGDLYWDNLISSQWPDPVLRNPETVNEHHFMARKLSKQGKYLDSIKIYENLVEHLIKTVDEARKAK
jgi:UDP-glucose/galactose:(glucosyl)LPS alpha-1,2-glucosyl/galactosyltransferase